MTFPTEIIEPFEQMTEACMIRFLQIYHVFDIMVTPEGKEAPSTTHELVLHSNVEETTLQRLLNVLIARGFVRYAAKTKSFSSTTLAVGYRTAEGASTLFRNHFDDGLAASCRWLKKRIQNQEIQELSGNENYLVTILRDSKARLEATMHFRESCWDHVRRRIELMTNAWIIRVLQHHKTFDAFPAL